MSWWQRLLIWLGTSEPGGRKEQVEDWIEAHQAEIVDFAQRQDGRFSLRNHYFQRLKGWLKPTDDNEDQVNSFAGLLPVWADVGVDVYEEPIEPRGTSRKGYVLNIYVTEIDASKWVLRIDSRAGPLGWTDITPLPLP